MVEDTKEEMIVVEDEIVIVMIAEEVMVGEIVIVMTVEEVME